MLWLLFRLRLCCFSLAAAAAAEVEYYSWDNYGVEC
jgi:hypothetical protein